MQIEILDVKVNTVPTAKGSYQVAEVAYKELDTGKVNGKKVMSFGDKNVFKRLTMARANEKFDVGMDKDDKGYWQWTSLKEITGEAVAPQQTTKTNVAPRSTYETAEERAARQRFIINQSSISSAIALLKTEKTIPHISEILETATVFADFVYDRVGQDQGKLGGAASIDSLENNIPY